MPLAHSLALRACIGGAASVIPIRFDNVKTNYVTASPWTMQLPA